MKVLRPRTFIIFALVALSGTVLLQTSQRVQQSEERLEFLELSVYREQEKIRMLKAEWEVLNRPDRLERLSEEFLNLVPPSSSQLVSGGVELPAKREVGFEGAGSSSMQPVSVGRDVAIVPRPVRKPVDVPGAPTPRRGQVEKTKAFGDLLEELGSAGGGQ